MISPTLDSLRLFLHVLAASVWVGGQIVLGGLVPQVRRSNPEALRGIATAFGKIAWPAFGLAVVTGMWNLMDVNPGDHGSAYLVTLGIKMGAVATAAVATLVHSNGRSKVALAVGGALGLLSSLVVAYLGVLLHVAG